MEQARFSILEAVGKAYAFVGREWLYLAKVAALPVLVQICTALFIQFQRPGAGRIEGFLWDLPATVLLAWFLFLETRLILLGEKLNAVPPSRAYLAERRNAMRTSVMLFLAFNMSVTAITALLHLFAASGRWGTDTLLTFAGLTLMGVLFWGLRFGILPILAAVHYPARPVLRQTWGFMFSLRLLGMGMACLFPVLIFFQFVFFLLLPQPVVPGQIPDLSPSSQALLVAAAAPLSILGATLLNAAAVFALKQILGRRNGGAIA